MQRLIGLLFGTVVALLSAGAAAAEGKIVVASKIDTEGALLGNMIVALLEAHGLTVENKLQLGPTNIVRAAILAGQIDIYPEYTGNGALFFHLEQDPVWKDWAKGAAKVAALDRETVRLEQRDDHVAEQCPLGVDLRGDDDLALRRRSAGGKESHDRPENQPDEPLHRVDSASKPAIMSPELTGIFPGCSAKIPEKSSPSARNHCVSIA